VAFAEENTNCCKCTCYRRTEEHEAGPGTVFSAEEGERVNDVPVEAANEGDFAESREAEQHQNDEDDGEGVRGIYGMSMSRNLTCLCIGAWDMHW
jgi:hypothetical protein